MKNGIVLGRVLYLSHGKCPTHSATLVFDDAKVMKSNGFELYCKDPLNRPVMEDSSELSKQTRAAGIAFAVQLCLAASSNFMRKEANRTDFQRSVGAGTGAGLSALKSGIEIEAVTHFINIRSGEISQILDMKNPGTGDILGVYLQELNRQKGNGSIGFQRGNVLGFDVAAVPLAQETVIKIRQACKDFNW